MLRGVALSLLVVTLSSLIASAKVVFLVITVKTSRPVVRRCISSLVRHRSLFLPQRVILVDDGSPDETFAFERQLCTKWPSVYSCLSSKRRGYTHAVNQGIETAISLSENHEKDSIVLLNSDVVVTEGWLEGLHEALTADNETMLVGPISNAATHQSVPRIKSGKHNRNWAVNQLPPTRDLESFSAEIRRTAKQMNIKRVPIIILNGFCFMFKISLISSIGFFDTNHFPKGYGEEVDFSMKAFKAGYKAYIAPTVYLYHEKTASFTEADKIQLKKHANPTLKELYGNDLEQATIFAQDVTAARLQPLRHRVMQMYNAPLIKKFKAIYHFSVIFLFDSVSVRSEILPPQLYRINALLSLGIEVLIGVDSSAKKEFLRVLRLISIDHERFLSKILYHRDYKSEKYDARFGFLSDSKFRKVVAMHDIIVAHSYQLVKTLNKKLSPLASHMIMYHMSDYYFYTGESTLYEMDNLQQCASEIISKGMLVWVDNSDSEKVLSRRFPSLRVHNAGVLVDRNVFFMDDTSLTFQLNFSKVFPKYVTLYSSAASFSVNSSALHILNVAKSLIQDHKDSIHVNIAHFGVSDPVSDFREHIHIKIGPTHSLLEDLLMNRRVKFFGQKDLRYASLLRKSHAFVDMTYGPFSPQRVTEAIASGSIIIGNPAACPARISAFCFDLPQGVEDIVTVINQVLVLPDEEIYHIKKAYEKATEDRNVERNAAEWAIFANKEMANYRGRQGIDIIL